ncbi:MAG: efflux transporter outer membrane subunit [Muribaculaceae bacterium]|nr:efflux transporter outer membrane subunit [Muribaculaceae bacterium]
MKINRIIIALAAAVSLLASACSGVRNCAAPQLHLPDTFGERRDSTTIADMEWWKFYTDSALVYIIEETLAHNRNFLAAAAKVEQMRELYGLSKANMLPTLSGIALADHETNDYYGEHHSEQPEFSLKARLGWEVDLWGGLKWAKKQGLEDYRASLEDERAMRISLIAEAASAYIRLMALDNELAIVRRTLFTREENLKKAKLRYEGGLTSQIVYNQAQVEYASTAALIPGLERQIEEQKNALTLLMGRYPADEIARGKLSMDGPSATDLPMGLPSTLLERRPDIRSAEASLRSAMAGVGVAYANRFPNLRIELTGGLENDDIKGFLNSPFTYVLGQIAGPIFDFGRNKRKYKAAMAAYNQSRYAYEQKVLNAFREVDDAATAVKLTIRTTDRRRELREAAQNYAQLAYVQYNGGVLNYIDVLDAQRRYFEAQVGVNNAVRDEYLALIALYKALGGGWNKQ